MISALGRFLNRVSRRWMPDPFLLAVLLTLLVFVAGWLTLCVAGSTAPSSALYQTVQGWQERLFATKLLAFAFQMCLMLTTGYALASAPLVARLVRRLADAPRTAHSSVALVAFVSCGMALIHWGLGLIVGAMIAKEVGRSAARRGIPHHYPLLGAAGYTGLMVWGGGLSGSIPLMAQQEKVAGLGLENTLFSSLNFITSGLLLVTIPLICLLLVPKSPANYEPCPLGGDDSESDDDPTAKISKGGKRFALGVAGVAALLGLVQFIRVSGGVKASTLIYGLVNGALLFAVVQRTVALSVAFLSKQVSGRTPAQRIETNELVTVTVCLLGLGWLEYLVMTGHYKHSFNTLNFAFLFLGLLFQGTPIRYVRAIAEGAKGCAGIILQFPLYFGILGIFAVTGLGALISNTLAAMANETIYPVITYLSAGLVNLFVPSGGGQWLVQGKIVVSGAQKFSGIVPKSVMALTYGDAWTNMLQPFWALPLLAITQLKAREIIGYTATIMIFGGVLTVVCLLVL
jgi:short-chain fatty acids transporter